MTRKERLDEFDPHRCIKYEDNWTFVEEVFEDVELAHEDEDVIDVDTISVEEPKSFVISGYPRFFNYLDF